MKNSSHKSKKSGFTLIELLVVIFIISILAAASFAAGKAAMNKARKLSSQATAMSIQTAVEQFYLEYSALPEAGASDETIPFSTITDPGPNLLNILAAVETTATIQNTRKIRFLNGKDAKNDMDGIKYNANGTINAIYDAWGKPFYIVLDYTYDERLDVVVPTNPTDTTFKLNGRRVAVYSLGVKKDEDANAGTVVKTW